MNENNQPQSQQTDINRLQFEAKLSEFISSQQNIPPDIAKVVREHFWDLIEDTRKAQPSHSPTEQPGDGKHTRGPWTYAYNGFGSHVVYSTDGSGTRICEMQQGPLQYNAELIARAPALLSEVETLREENARLKAECSSHEKERYEIYSFDSSQAMEIKALRKELEQLRSERAKMREAWKSP